MKKIQYRYIITYRYNRLSAELLTNILVIPIREVKVFTSPLRTANFGSQVHGGKNVSNIIKLRFVIYEGTIVGLLPNELVKLQLLIREKLS